MAAGGGVEPPCKAFAVPLKPGLIPTVRNIQEFIIIFIVLSLCRIFSKNSDEKKGLP